MIFKIFRNIIGISYPIIFFYIIFYLGWGESCFTNFFSEKFIILMISLINILHLFIFFDKKIEKDYKSMILLSFFILIIPIIFFIKNFIYNGINKEISSYIKIFSIISLIIYLVIRTTYIMKRIYVKIHNPIFIFIISFIFLSILGSILLMLPASTVKNISFIDALFTSTSAVCVTGLIVLDTSKDFTFLGKIILLTLIEIGGLGILTITSFFNFFFQNNLSFKEAIFASNFLNTKTTNNVLFFAVKVVLFTLIIELVGSFLIYLSINNDFHFNTKLKLNNDNPFFFSIFHSISSFCNSGFSTFNDGLHSEVIRFNYWFQLIISFLIILGGIGFNIVFNFFTFILLTLKKYINKIFYKKYIRNPVHIVTLNTKIVVFTTIFLLYFGTIFYYISEYNNSLLEHKSFFGKWIVSFFSSTSSRTAGFHVLDLKNLHSFTIIFTMLLMWIGASPSSTGGGIKTITFAIALLNIVSLSRKKHRLEIQKREISHKSIRLSFSIIMLSIIIIYICVLSIIFFDPYKNILSIFFEVVSAFSTTGLSLGITSSLSIGSKLVIILLMLLGRVGSINIMISLLKRNKINIHYYKYPKENVIIN
ncbi:TrkH family potassium uptake protein [Blattabacterium cuenoti]|uniref:TrkH family potassium uptake protein n=1 Tax=Blattabacterium cuenoti TaxID=1653831 RepID=UPI00163C1DAC|nr:potassium transporter TrkG [Blattabacterium cuenoti]